ncbi:MAG: hypothetical protein BA862_09170 [Desulfobulbaceae bacterium S3730MH12]|nr:MAG: hypothetical protein BA866_05660 [Desulfobulbaceae bacterium S5133MH15]OEU56990.1 MAG: hypothetical protein BA862_09170 [Desulfobulbaceae bacterium S3730MH12]OEU82147.1 MAG: hypothetical protein BA873_11550 [Desulfobulbaceae bacterium C00003063]
MWWIGFTGWSVIEINDHHHQIVCVVRYLSLPIPIDSFFVSFCLIVPMYTSKQRDPIFHLYYQEVVRE